MSGVVGVQVLPRFSAESWDRMLGTNLSGTLEGRRLPPIEHEVKDFAIHWPLILTCKDCGARYRQDISDEKIIAHGKATGHQRWRGERVMPWHVPADTGQATLLGFPIVESDALKTAPVTLAPIRLVP